MHPLAHLQSEVLRARAKDRGPKAQGLGSLGSRACPSPSHALAGSASSTGRRGPARLALPSQDHGGIVTAMPGQVICRTSTVTGAAAAAPNARASPSTSSHESD